LQIQQIDITSKRFYSDIPLTLEMLRERVILVLRLYDKVDPEKVDRVFSVLLFSTV